MAMDWIPLERDEAVKRGYRWSEQDQIPRMAKVIDARQLPDSIDDIPDDVLQWALICEACKKPYVLAKKEYEFYKAQRIPVPHLHPDERHRARKSLRNPRTLWTRECGECSKEIQTSFAPGRPETVLCETCYLQKVY